MNVCMLHALYITRLYKHVLFCSEHISMYTRVKVFYTYYVIFYTLTLVFKFTHARLYTYIHTDILNAGWYTA